MGVKTLGGSDLCKTERINLRIWRDSISLALSFLLTKKGSRAN